MDFLVLSTFETSFLIFPPPRRRVVEHEFFVVETFSRGKRIRNERKLEKELFCSRFEPVESTSGSKNCSKFSLAVRMINQVYVL